MCAHKSDPRVAALVVVAAFLLSPYAVALSAGSYDSLDYTRVGSPERPIAAALAVRSYADTRVAGLDLSDGNAIAAAVSDIKSQARSRIEEVAHPVQQAANASLFVQKSFAQSSGIGAPGLRTRLETARGPAGLAEGTLALYAALGKPVTLSEELRIRSDAANVPPQAALAGAVAIFATLDALGYVKAAFATADFEALRAVDGNETVLATLHRRMEFTPGNGGLTLGFPSLDEAQMHAAARAARSVDQAKLAQALDVLAQAADEIGTLQLIPNLQGSFSKPLCSPSTTLLFATDDCLVIVGGSADDTYYRMQGGSRHELNVVLVDVGGHDTYLHRAGGGFGELGAFAGCTTSATVECWAAVQSHFDLGSGNDRYYPGSALEGKVRGPAHGAGFLGAGILYDQGGNDRYNATHLDDTAPAAPLRAVSMVQGAGQAGAGLLLDMAGNDVYESWQRRSAPAIRAQAAATVGGIGLLRDAGGNDQYYHNVTPFTTFDGTLVPTDGGGAQAFAAAGGVAYLLDRSGNDVYRAGQDLVQGAASLQAFAMLLDPSGTDRFQVVSTRGCAELASALVDQVLTPVCDRLPSSRYEPLAGWSQGYANLGGLGAIVGGSGSSRYETIRYVGGGVTTRQFEGRDLLAAGNTTGLGIVLEVGGNDDYDASLRSLGFADHGTGVFADVGGDDVYRCADVTCCGYEIEGVGAFYDGESGGDTIACTGEGAITMSWFTTPRGIGLHVAPAGGSCVCTPLGENGRYLYQEITMGP